MLPLRDLQAAMAASVFATSDAPLAALVRGDGIAADQRLAVYRNNTMVSLTAALQETFSVVCRLVDERFFKFAAHSYIVAHPPRAPRLSEYGEDFASFLAGFAPVRHLPYLPDVARLEWAVNLAFNADDAPSLNARRIADLPMERYGALVFKLHPSCRLLESAFPVDRIWDAHQPGGSLAAGIDLDSGACRLLIDRHDNVIRFLSLDPAGLAFLAALAAGQPLQDAAAATGAADPSFDLTGTLAAHLTRGTFADFIDSASSEATPS